MKRIVKTLTRSLLILYPTIFILLLFASCRSGQQEIEFNNFGKNLYNVPDSSSVNGVSFYKPTNVESELYYDYKSTPPYQPVFVKFSEIKNGLTNINVFRLDKDLNNKFDPGIDLLGFGPVGLDSIFIEDINSWIFKMETDSFFINIDDKGYVFSKNDKGDLVLSFVPKIQDKNVPQIYSHISFIDSELISEDGRKIKMSDLFEQGKSIVFDFWFAGCRGCIREFPKLVEIADCSNFKIYGLNSIDEIPRIKEIKEKHNLSFSQYKCSKDLHFELGNLGYYPSKLVFSEDGQLKYNFANLHQLNKISDSKI